MATFTQWSRSMAREGAQPRRVTWLHGSPVLREEAITRTRQLIAPTVYVPVTAGMRPEQDTWDTCLQLPAPGETRLAVVRSAQHLRNWETLAFLGTPRDSAGLWVVFSSDEDCYQRKSGKVAVENGKKVLQPGPAAVSALSGQLVKCALSSQEDQIAWIQGHLPGLPATVAWRIIDRTGADLALCTAVCAQLAVFAPDERTEDAVVALVPQEPAQEFAEAIVLDRKAAAVRAAPAPDEIGTVLGQLGFLLDHLSMLYSAALQELNMRDTVKLGVPQVVAVKYRKVASRYPPARVLACRMLLAEMDAQWRSGAREGVAEAVAALW